MKCSDAQSRIDKLLRQGQPVEVDSVEGQHLAGCPTCRRLYEASSGLQTIYNSAGTDDPAGIVPFEVQRQRIQARAVRGETVHIGRRPGGVRIAVAAAAVVILIVAALVPFTYERIMGYNVAFAGVNYECGSDCEIICDILYELGLDDANVDHMGCDSTCALLVLDLKNQREVNMVVSAFAELCRTQVDTSVIPVIRRGSSTLLYRAHKKVTSSSDS